MERYADTVLGLWMFGIGYSIHWLLYPFWRRNSLHPFLHIPLAIAAWSACIGLLLPFKDFVVVVSGFFDHPTAGAAFEVGMFATLATLLAWLYQNSDVFRYQELKPFIAASMFFRHGRHARTDMAAEQDQKRIDALATSPEDKKLLKNMAASKRIPLDRARELLELDVLRRKRQADAGKEERAHLAAGRATDITDVFRLYHLAGSPHPLYEKTFHLSIDPAGSVCEARIVFGDITRDHLNDPKRWFRFRQDLFDVAETVYHQDWMERFRPFYTRFEIECYQEETDSFGLPRRRAFLRVGIPATVLQEYKGRIFIATDLDTIGTITWLEGDPS